MEVAQVRRACPAPAINRLVRVAHRKNGTLGEKVLEKAGLQEGRVLIFIQENLREILAFAFANCWNLANSAFRQGNLIAVIYIALTAFLFGIGGSKFGNYRC